MEKHTVRLTEPCHIEDNIQVYLMSELLQGLTVILITILLLQNLGRGYQ
jgi:hypothetical protein